MADQREAILARLLAVAAAVSGVLATARNEPDFGELRRPSMTVFEGDEQADDSDPVRQRPTNAPRRVTMTPQIIIAVGGPSETVGTTINSLRSALIKAVLSDATLQSLCAAGRGAGLWYEGSSTELGRGRTMEAEMTVAFSFQYFLFPGDL